MGDLKHKIISKKCLWGQRMRRNSAKRSYCRPKCL